MTQEFLISLANSAGVSGFEHETAAIIRETFAKFCDEVRTDKLGNVIGHKKGGGKAKIMFAAHMDEIGLMVSGYEEGGFLRFTNVGGYDQRSLVSQEVIVHGKERIYGVIGVKPPHITTPEEAKNAHKMEDMAIDTGYSDEKLKALVRIGDIVTIKRQVVQLCGDTLAGKALDDRAGVATLLECMKTLQNADSDIDVYYVATVQEEIGAKGALTAAYDIEPDIAVAIDVGHGITPEIDEEKGLKMGGGPGIARGINIHPRVFEYLVKAAKENYIPYQVKVSPFMSGTDAMTMQISNLGSCTGVLSIPEKYMHTSVETLQMKDVILTGRLLAAFVLELSHKDMEELLCL